MSSATECLSWEGQARARWFGPGTLVCDGVQFQVLHGPVLEAQRSTEDCLVLGKERSMLERMLGAIRGRPVRNVLDIGIYKGGSAAFYHQLFRPKKLVAVDWERRPVAALAGYIARHGAADSLRPYYGVNQADGQRLRQIIEDEFAGEPIDLVIDDASHRYRETRATLNAVLPYTRPGATYVIEDWAWAHWPGRRWQRGGVPFGRLLGQRLGGLARMHLGWFFRDEPALTNLLVELTILCAARSDIAAELIVDPSFACLRRGPGEIPRSGFDIGDHLLNRGRRFSPVL